MQFSLPLPRSIDGDQRSEILVEDGWSIVIVGPNGSGKSRLGEWIERQVEKRRTVHRIGAQRALSIPPNIPFRHYDDAQELLYFGAENPGRKRRDKWANRWHNEPTTSLLTDFQHVLSLILASRFKRDSDYVDLVKTSLPTVSPEVPPAPSDIILSLWDNVFPHRKLLFDFDKGTISASKPDDPSSYFAGRMSDGERVALYLMGQCLVAPENAILIVDEPEIHLHKAIMARLWDELEASRPDCLFIYITHDLEFAASRAKSRKIVVSAYDGKAWNWSELSSADGIPEDVALKILGSRKPVLFVEGAKNKFDDLFYRTMYPDRLVIPLGSSAQVIAVTKAFSAVPEYHYWNVHGIIDRDFRTDTELDSHQKNMVFALNVAEIENVFCTEEVVKLVAARIFPVDADEVFEKVRQELFARLEAEFPAQALKRTEMIVDSQIRVSLGGGHEDIAALQQKLHDIPGNIDVGKIHTESLELYETVLRNLDYQAALRIYNNKGLISCVAKCFSTDLRATAYKEMVIKLLSEPDLNLREKLQKYLPIIE